MEQGRDRFPELGGVGVAFLWAPPGQARPSGLLEQHTILVGGGRWFEPAGGLSGNR